MGLGQLMPGTAREMGVVNPWDPQQNLSGSSWYLRAQLVTFGGNLPLALAAYKAGAGNVRAAGGVPNFPETTAYVKKILALAPLFEQIWRRWVGAPQPTVTRMPAQVRAAVALPVQPAVSRVAPLPSRAPVVQAITAAPSRTRAVPAVQAAVSRVTTASPDRLMVAVPAARPSTPLLALRAPPVTATGMQLVHAAGTTASVPGNRV